MEDGANVASTITPLATDGYWSDPSNVDDYLARKLKAGSTSLVLGAGASHGFNLPDWKALVEAVRVDSGATPPATTKRPEDEADHLLSTKFDNDRMRFAKAVRQALYSPASHQLNFMLKSDLLQAIAAFLTNSLRGRSGAVVTFNFDDILETYLKLLGFVVRSETSVPAWSSNADVLVYHPHGLLPIQDETGMTEIVFTTSDFDKVIGRPQAWNTTMKSVWSTTFPVFIGLSGDDGRLRSLLDETQATHPAKLKDGSKYWGVRPTLITADTYEINRWKQLGIVNRPISSYSELPAWLLSICQLAAALT